MRLTEHAVALGKAGAKKRWDGIASAERKRVMESVRAAKLRPASSESRNSETNSAQRRRT
jgi:hypothetical protein